MKTNSAIRHPSPRLATAHGRPQRARLVGAVVLALLVAVIAGSHMAHDPPDPQPATRPSEEFSAVRAFPHVERVAAVPHPVGSEANAAARDYIIGELRALGLEPAVLEGPVVRAPSVALVENIHARIPGHASTGHVVLAAHYDSVPAGPGAADDGAGVAAILEVARALMAGPAPRNDIDIVFTDAEEPELLGARAFVESDLIDPERSLVLNLEARGTSGPVLMFETSPRNGNLIAALASIESPPIAASMLQASYRMAQAFGTNTDFTEFRQAGYSGMNFAFVEGLARYHTATDSPPNLDQASLQHHGTITLALARNFGDRDLGALSSTDDVTYFSVLGRLASYRLSLATPLAILAAVAFAATAWYGRRRGLRLLAVAGTMASFPLAIVVAAVLASGAWWVLGRLRPGYLSLGSEITYRPQWYEWALVLLAVTVTVGWYLLLRRRVNPIAVSLGVVGWLVVGAVAAGFLLPEGAYLLTWPALIGSAGLAVALRLGDRSAGWAQVLAAAAAFPAVLLAVPLVDFQLGFTLAAMPVSMVVLLAATAMPLLGLVAGRRPMVAVLLPAVATLVLFGVGFAVDRFDARNPQQTNLVYALDAELGQASWASADPLPPPWTAQYVGGEPAMLADFPSLGSRRYRTGPAPVADLTAPSLEVTRTRQDGDDTVLELQVDAGGASRVDLFADTSSHTVVAATVAGLSLDPGDERHAADETGRWTWGIEVHGVPNDGTEITLRFRGDGPLPLRVVSHQPGLPEVPEFEPMPDDLTQAKSGFPTLVARTYELP